MDEYISYDKTGRAKRHKSLRMAKLRSKLHKQMVDVDNNKFLRSVADYR